MPQTSSRTWVERLEDRTLFSAPGTNWSLAWGDEFDGTRLDAGKWSTGLPWTGPDGSNRYVGPDHLSYFSDDDVAVGGGELQLLTRRQDVSDSSGNLFHYTAGMISSAQSFSFAYGYVEVRAQAAVGAGPGLWPVVWMLGGNGWPPEMDLAEWFTSTNRFHQGLAYGSKSGVRWDDVNTSTPLAAGWHTYGMEWGPGYQVYTVDDKITHTSRGSYVPNQPMYLLLESGVASAHPPTADTAFPNALEIDYVRVYQRNGTPGISNPGFEGGQLGDWTTTGPAAVVAANAHSGTYSLQAHGLGAAASQVLLGLKPRSTYQVTAWAEVSDSATQAAVGLESAAGTQVLATSSATQYAPLGFTFTTAAGQHSATLVAAQNGGAGYAWFDDFQIRQVVPLKLTLPRARTVRAGQTPAAIPFRLKGVAPDRIVTFTFATPPSTIPATEVLVEGANGVYALQLPTVPDPGVFTLTLTAQDDTGRRVTGSIRVKVVPDRRSR